MPSTEEMKLINDKLSEIGVKIGDIPKGIEGMVNFGMYTPHDYPSNQMVKVGNKYMTVAESGIEPKTVYLIKKSSRYFANEEFTHAFQDKEYIGLKNVSADAITFGNKLLPQVQERYDLLSADYDVRLNIQEVEAKAYLLENASQIGLHPLEQAHIKYLLATNWDIFRTTIEGGFLDSVVNTDAFNNWSEKMSPRLKALLPEILVR